MRNLPFDSARDIAVELKTHFPGFHARPYNWRRPDTSSFWWLAGNGQNPAFHLGKAVVRSDDDYEVGDCFCGLFVEKGLETSLASNPREFMKPDWFWHHFVKVAGQPLADAILEAENALGEKLEIRMTGVLNEGESFARFRFLHDGGRLVRDDDNFDKDQGQLAPIAGVSSIDEFGDGLRDLTGKPLSEWLWITVNVGAPFTLNKSGHNDLELCAAMLRPFEHWIRHGSSA